MRGYEIAIDRQRGIMWKVIAKRWGISMTRAQQLYNVYMRKKTRHGMEVPTPYSLDTPVGRTMMSVRLLNACLNNECVTMQDVIERRDTFSRLPNVGPKSIQELDEILRLVV